MSKSVREQQRALREQLILDSAYELLTEQGYQKMTMDELAARVGIAKMTLYQHFASKEALAVGVIVRGMKQIEAELAPVFLSERPALARLQDVLSRSLAQRSVFRQINLDVLPALVLQNPAYQAENARIAAQWAQLIDLAKTEGTVDSALATAALVRMLFSAFQTNYDDLVSAGVVTADALAHTLLTVAIKGMRA